MLQNTFYEASIILISKLDKDTTKENYRSIFLMNIDVKVFNRILVNHKPISTIHWKCHILCSNGTYSRSAGMVQHLQINMIHYINKMKDKNHMIISIEEEKSI